MDAKGSIWKKEVVLNNTIVALVKCFITVWTFSDSLSYMNPKDAFMNDTFLNLPRGWGMNGFFIFLGVGTVYYLMRNRQKSPWISGISALFAISTVIGISYSKIGTWDCVFGSTQQFLVAFLVILGYYYAYKNGILFAAWLFEKKTHLLRREPVNRIEIFLFEKHPFAGQLLFLFIAALPWMIFFCPGTLQWDGCTQLWIFLGNPEVADRAGQNPVILTQIMGGCVWLGRQLFHSDAIGLFVYNILQYVTQILVFAYAGFVLRKLRVPVLFSWGALLYWGVYPLFPIWGYTMVKDTPFYIFILLHIVTLMDMLACSQKTRAKGWQLGLFLLSIAGVCLSRNDGQYVILLTLFCALFLYRKYWKIYAAGIAACLLLIFAVNYIYMPLNHIAKGAHTGDILSIPLQQTGRYFKLHFDEVTEEEAEILQEVFDIPLEEISQQYHPQCADTMKMSLKTHLDSYDLKSYFKVWFRQFLKHPDTYIQAFLNHNYGYFYPDEHDYLYGYMEVTAIFYIVEEEHYDDGWLDISFAIPNKSGRGMLEDFFYTVEKMPLLGMLKSAGLQVYFLLGECVYLLAKKRRREILILIPVLFVLLLRLFSPVACVRYVLPIMAALPVTAAWCYIVTHKKEFD